MNTIQKHTLCIVSVGVLVSLSYMKERQPCAAVVCSLKLFIPAGLLEVISFLHIIYVFSHLGFPELILLVLLALSLRKNLSITWCHV